jgi:regulator of sigma E protease
MSVLFFIGVLLALSFFIVVHEWGHFFVAKRFKLFVEEFGVGFPPRILSIRRFSKSKRHEVDIERIETKEIDIKTQEGEEVIRETITEDVRVIDGGAQRKKWHIVWGRASQEETHEHIPKGETVYALNLVPLGGYVRIFGESGTPEGTSHALAKRSFSAQPVWKRILIIVAGIAMNLFVGWLILSAVFMIGAPQGVLVTQVLPGSPGEVAGFHTQDLITGYTTIDTFINFVNSHAGKSVQIAVRRASEELMITVVPRSQTVVGQGRIGVAIQAIGFPRESFFVALKDGFMMTAWIFWMIFLTLYEVVKSLFGHGAALGEVSGPVGIFQAAYSAGGLGFTYVLELIGVISINLAALNILPIPGLDGGRFLFLVIEKVRGVQIEPRREAMIHGIGVAALIILILIVTFHDLTRLF